MRMLAATLLVLAGCARAGLAGGGGALPSPGACTLDTPLVPGVPGSPGHLVPTEVNPDGQSELAVLMRTMVKDLTAARDEVRAGRRPAGLVERHRKLRCAWPTDPADRTATFDALAVAYLTRLEALERGPAPPGAGYQGVVEGCAGCHEASCPGPLEVIDGLR